MGGSIQKSNSEGAKPVLMCGVWWETCKEVIGYGICVNILRDKTVLVKACLTFELPFLS